MTLRRIILGLAATLVALVGVALPAGAATLQYPPPAGGGGGTSSGTVVSGGTVTFTGSGFTPSSTVVITVNGVQVATTTADTSGSFSTPVTLTGSGTQVLAATGTAPGGGLQVVSASVQVLAASVTNSGTTSGTTSGTSGTALPRTGSDVLVPGLALGGGLVVVGSMAVAVASRRRRLGAASIQV